MRNRHRWAVSLTERHCAAYVPLQYGVRVPLYYEVRVPLYYEVRVPLYYGVRVAQELREGEYRETLCDLSSLSL